MSTEDRKLKKSQSLTEVNYNCQVSNGSYTKDLSEINSESKKAPDRNKVAKNERAKVTPLVVPLKKVHQNSEPRKTLFLKDVQSSLLSAAQPTLKRNSVRPTKQLFNGKLIPEASTLLPNYKRKLSNFNTIEEAKISFRRQSAPGIKNERSGSCQNLVLSKNDENRNVQACLKRCRSLSQQWNLSTSMSLLDQLNTVPDPEELNKEEHQELLNDRMEVLFQEYCKIELGYFRQNTGENKEENRLKIPTHKPIDNNKDKKYTYKTEGKKIFSLPKKENTLITNSKFDSNNVFTSFKENTILQKAIFPKNNKDNEKTFIRKIKGSNILNDDHLKKITKDSNSRTNIETVKCNNNINVSQMRHKNTSESKDKQSICDKKLTNNLLKKDIILTENKSIQTVTVKCPILNKSDNIEAKYIPQLIVNPLSVESCSTSNTLCNYHEVEEKFGNNIEYSAKELSTDLINNYMDANISVYEINSNTLLDCNKESALIDIDKKVTNFTDIVLNTNYENNILSSEVGLLSKTDESEKTDSLNHSESSMNKEIDSINMLAVEPINSLNELKNKIIENFNSSINANYLNSSNAVKEISIKKNPTYIFYSEPMRNNEEIIEIKRFKSTNEMKDFNITSTSKNNKLDQITDFKNKTKEFIKNFGINENNCEGNLINVEGNAPFQKSNTKSQSISNNYPLSNKINNQNNRPDLATHDIGLVFDDRRNMTENIKVKDVECSITSIRNYNTSNNSNRISIFERHYRGRRVDSKIPKPILK